MSGSTAIIIAASANANAAAANARAARAERAACEAMVPSVDPRTATAEVQQQYAHCIEILHPHALSGGDAMLVKALIIIGFVAWAITAWWMSRDDDVLLAIFVGFFSALLVPLVLLMIGSAIAFLFS